VVLAVQKIDALNLFYFNPTSGSSSRYKEQQEIFITQKMIPDRVSEKRQLIYKIEALGWPSEQGWNKAFHRRIEQNVSNCNTVSEGMHMNQICVQPPEVPDTFYLYPDNDLPSGPQEKEI